MRIRDYSYAAYIGSYNNSLSFAAKKQAKPRFGVTTTEPKIGVDGILREGPAPVFNILTGEFADHSMPHRNIWKNYVSDQMMNEAIAMANPAQLVRIKNAPIDVVDIGSGYGDFLNHAVIAMYKASGRKQKAYGLEYVPLVVDLAKAISEDEYQLSRYISNAVTDPVFKHHDLFNTAHIAERMRLIPKGSVKLVILSSMLHMSPKQNTELLEETKRILAPGGCLLLTHWYKGFPQRGPTDNVRPLPEEIIARGLWGEDSMKMDISFRPKGSHFKRDKKVKIHRATVDHLNFVGYRPLSKGLYAIAMEKPASLLTSGAGKGVARSTIVSLFGKEFAETNHDIDTKGMDIYLYNLHKGLTRLKTPDEYAVYTEGLTWDFCVRNLWFTKAIWNAYVKNPDASVDADIAQLIKNPEEHGQGAINETHFIAMKKLIGYMQNPANIKPELHAQLGELNKILDRSPLLQKSILPELSYFGNTDRRAADEILRQAMDNQIHYFEHPELRYTNPLYFEARRRVLGWCYLALQRGSHFAAHQVPPATYSFLPELTWLLKVPSALEPDEMEQIKRNTETLASPIFEQTPTLSDTSEIGWSKLFRFINRQKRRAYNRAKGVIKKGKGPKRDKFTPLEGDERTAFITKMRAIKTRISHAKTKPAKRAAKKALNLLLATQPGVAFQQEMLAKRIAELKSTTIPESGEMTGQAKLNLKFLLRTPEGAACERHALGEKVHESKTAKEHDAAEAEFQNFTNRSQYDPPQNSRIWSIPPNVHQRDQYLVHKKHLNNRIFRKKPKD